MATNYEHTHTEPTSNVRMADAYGDGSSLDLKWEVMRKYRTSKENFEDWLIRLLPLREGMRILDIGAGSGRFTIPIARRLTTLGGRITSLDVLPGVLEPIRRALLKEPDLPIDLVVGDASKLPIELGNFDVQIAAHMLYHLDDIPASLARMRQHLADDGIFVATTNSAAGMPELFELHKQTLAAVGLDMPAFESTDPFTLENGHHILSQVFKNVETYTYDGGFTALSADPVFSYYSGTELYRQPVRDQDVPFDVRARIAPTFVHLAQEAVDRNGGRMLIRKEVGAFVCRKLQDREHSEGNFCEKRETA